MSDLLLVFVLLMALFAILSWYRYTFVDDIYQWRNDIILHTPLLSDVARLEMPESVSQELPDETRYKIVLLKRAILMLERAIPDLRMVAQNLQLKLQPELAPNYVNAMTEIGRIEDLTTESDVTQQSYESSVGLAQSERSFSEALDRYVKAVQEMEQLSLELRAMYAEIINNRSEPVFV